MRKKIVLFVILVLFFSFSGLYTYFVIDLFSGVQDTIIKSEVTVSETSLNTSVEKVIDAVVVVEVFYQGSLISTGSGFVYKKDATTGYILTNYHVIQGGTTIQVTFSDKTTATADIIGADKSIDIAVLGVSQNKVLQVATLGDSKLIEIGDTIFTVGAPEGIEYQGTVTKGIISAADRYLTLTNENNDDYLLKVLQTDAAINPGNSGGPLVNINGEVIGITSLKLGDTDEVEGISFAIPIEDLTNYISILEKGQPIVKATIDLEVVNLSDSATINKLGLTSDGAVNVGVMIINVADDIKTFKKGDIIIAIDNVEIANTNYFNYLISRYTKNDVVSIRYYDGDIIRTTSVTLD